MRRRSWSRRSWLEFGLERDSHLQALYAELGAALAERSEGEWEVGPTIEFPIPLFDQGQARIGRGAVGLRRAQQAYYALAVRTRTVARTVRDRVQVCCPCTSASSTNPSCNTMQIGVFDLLRSQERHIQTAAAYINSQLNYWLARTDLDHLLSGRLPRSGGIQTMVQARSNGAADNGGH